ncbi:MAG: DUF1579 domain-containing protein [Bacteroidia bacterium]|nr:DUF1579 domain-containing protein [Bacteroidia bacterium]
MKKNLSTITLVFALLMSGSVIAQDKAETAPTQSESSENAAWEKYMALGEMHATLAKANGDWKVEMSFWMEPGGDPTKSTAKCTNKMILGGRFQESIVTGTVMGMPFEGKGLVGYDNIKKVFMSTWIDNMGTGMMHSEGPYEPKTKSMTLTGKMMDPMSGKEMDFREVFTMHSDAHHQLEMFLTHEGKEFKSMEINYRK